ncbi:YdcF family protein [Paracrocinitomix mangrovi]|uniref:YdcF family protein n=1 Tax=Paracrocinitomix mangrovi TaxID=2862509 RepID=UPI001C8EFBEF|nr:YdcF family protein [Paracrocinitomix mangrovi]UKN02578.1 YdcF family protein [Paracrocinitomix mangrovi]
MFFILSKIFSFLTHPFSWVIIALIISWITKRPKLKKYTFRGGIIALLFFSNSFIFLEFARMWEVDGTKIEDVGHYDCAIVLGGMAEYDSNLDRLSMRRGGDRIWQAINLYHLGKVDNILISGNNGYVMADELDEAVQFKKVLVENGIPEEDILVENKSKNTYENAVESKKIIDNRNDIQSILLVTSSLHMRRSRAVFKEAGFEHFDTFTTDHYTGKKRGYKFDQFLIPNVSTLTNWERLIHEWIGYVSYAIMGYL